MALVALVVTGCQEVPAAPQSTSGADHADPYERALMNFADCMRERGWDATVSDGGATMANVPQDQRAAQQADGQVCSKEWLTVDLGTFTEAEWQAAYDAARDTAACLERLGFSVSRPSLQVFVEGEGAWNPYLELIDAGVIRPAEMSRYEEKCPQPGYWPDRG